MVIVDTTDTTPPIPTARAIEQAYAGLHALNQTARRTQRRLDASLAEVARLKEEVARLRALTEGE